MRKGVVERATVLVGEWSRETAYCTIKRCYYKKMLRWRGIYKRARERREGERVRKKNNKKKQKRI